MRRKGLTDKQVEAIKRKAKRYIMADPEQRGLYLRIPPEGPIAFTAVARDPFGKQIWATIGTTADMVLSDARGRARETVRRIKDGTGGDQNAQGQARQRRCGGRELVATARREERTPFGRRRTSADRTLCAALLARSDIHRNQTRRHCYVARPN